jgi:hypothetical protein
MEFVEDIDVQRGCSSRRKMSKNLQDKIFRPAESSPGPRIDMTRRTLHNITSLHRTNTFHVCMTIFAVRLQASYQVGRICVSRRRWSEMVS